MKADLSKAVRIINNLDIDTDSDLNIVVQVAKSFEKKEEENRTKKKEFLQAIDAINGLKVDNSYSFDKEFRENHPILGDLENNIFFESPLFEAVQVGMKEPQYTTALGWFLQEDQQACRLFIETLAEVANFPEEFKKILPTEHTPIESIWEYSGKKNSQNEEDDETDSEGKEEKKAEEATSETSDISAGNDVKNRKEIDNLLIWGSDKKKHGIVIEIKFGADLHNELPCYQLTALKKMGYNPCQKNEKRCVFPTNRDLKCEDCQKNNSLMCVVLSTNRISAQKIEENDGCRKIWHRVLWCHFMPKLSKKMTQHQGNGDYRRFLSSLWRKVFETEG